MWAENGIPSGSIEVLDECRDTIPIGGKVSAEVTENLAKLSFEWETIGSGRLLIMALSHHLDTMEFNENTIKTKHKDDVLKG